MRSLKFELSTLISKAPGYELWLSSLIWLFYIFASYPATHLGVLNGLIDQIVATAVFCFLIAHTVDKRNHYPSWVQPFIIGSAFVLVGSAFALNAGYPCNPARDFGPRLFTLIAGYGWNVFSYQNYGWFWIPILGPFIGAIVGGWIYEIVVGFQTPDTAEYQGTTFIRWRWKS